MMRFYNQPYRFYAGIDLHARTLSLCVLHHDGRIACAKTLPTAPRLLLDALASFRLGLVVGCECMFDWYWLADLCHQENSPVVLGHALYLKAIHGGKIKTDRIDAEKLARLLRGGALPQAYVYPKGMRETRDLLRRPAPAAAASAAPPTAPRPSPVPLRPHPLQLRPPRPLIGRRPQPGHPRRHRARVRLPVGRLERQALLAQR